MRVEVVLLWFALDVLGDKVKLCGRNLGSHRGRLTHVLKRVLDKVMDFSTIRYQ